MTRRCSLARMLARSSLLVATASYLAIATVGPLAHLTVLEADRATAAQIPDTPQKKAPAPVHDETHCLLCHSLESIAAPATATALPIATFRTAPALVAPAGPRTEGLRPPTRARAPPPLA